MRAQCFELSEHPLLGLRRAIGRIREAAGRRQYLNAAGTEPIVLELDRPEPLVSLDIWQSDAYLYAKEIEVSV